jgi:uncharacterized protein DUF3617
MYKSVALVAFAMLVPAAFAQSAPFKMGLWENKITTTNGPADKEPDVLTSRSCVTPESWQRMFSGMAQKQGCTSSTSKTSNGYSFAASCSTAKGTAMNSKGVITIQSAERVVMDSHTVMTIGGKTRQVDMHGEGRFISSSCGNIKPGDPEVE